jgi:hypothetical protein
LDYQAALVRAEGILRDAGLEANPNNFLDYARTVADVVRDYGPAQRQSREAWLDDFALAWRRLYDDFDKIVAADPMVAYRPINPMALGFHKSNAFIRYSRTGNRCSKTQSGYAEHYFTLTGSHPYRDMPDWPASTLLVAGLPFTDYAPRVFEKKMLTGEDNNILSPMFPEGGKWFYHYDPRKYIITLACPECANAGKAGSCPGHHKKVTIALVSSEKGVGVIEAFTVRLFHIDEHVKEEIFQAGKMRVADNPGGCMIVTGTPLHGPEAWEARKLAAIADASDDTNRFDLEDPDSRPLVTLHTCSMYEGNIVSHDFVRMEERTYDDFEAEARIYGKPAPLAKNPVLDRKILAEMREGCTAPERYKLGFAKDKGFDDAMHVNDIVLEPAEVGPLRIWDAPEPDAQYLIAVDSAAGLRPNLPQKGGDASCASVLKVEIKRGKIYLDMVAQYHDWVNPLDYGEEIFKLAVHYNSAMVVIELTGGLGRAVMLKLSRDLAYWNIFRDTSQPEFAEFHQDARFGVETNASTKPFMVSALQQFVKDRALRVRCEDTIREMVAFEQETTTADGRALMVPRYRGAGGAHDDRVISLVIGASVVLTHPVYDFSVDMQVHAGEQKDQYDPTWQKIHESLGAGDPFAL